VITSSWSVNKFLREVVKVNSVELLAVKVKSVSFQAVRIPPLAPSAFKTQWDLRQRGRKEKSLDEGGEESLVS